MAYNYKLTISYDGTNYSGWQIQPNGISIQELIQDAIKVIFKEDVILIGSGRTDAGVHALSQIANFKSELKVDLFRLQGSLNGILPRDIRVLHVELVPLDFHAQRSAVSKSYHYHLALNLVQNPFNRLYCSHYRNPLDLEKLRQAAQCFIGTHDFTSFANEAHKGSASLDPVRTITALNIVDEEGGIRFEFEGNGFLYKMVRNIVGTILEVASGKREVSDIQRIFDAKDRKVSGQAAPAQGLFLVNVEY